MDPPLLLNSLSFSSMDFWVTALGGVSVGGAALEPLSCRTDNMAEGLELMDLLLHGLLLLLLELGWGMAETDGGRRAEVEQETDGGRREIGRAHV